MLVAAVGPFTTSDSLEMEPLHDLLRIVENEKPDVLLLVWTRKYTQHTFYTHDEIYHIKLLSVSCLQFGPFLDATHEMIKV